MQSFSQEATKEGNGGGTKGKKFKTAENRFGNKTAHNELTKEQQQDVANKKAFIAGLPPVPGRSGQITRYAKVKWQVRHRSGRHAGREG